MKRLLMIAGTVAVLGAAVLLVGGAATSAQEGDGPIGTFLGKVAEKLGVSQDELETAIKDARIEMIDEAVAEGRLTEEQAERLRERAEEGLFPLFGLGHRPMAGQRLVMDAATEVLDMTREELCEQLQDGQSLAEVAEAQGMSEEEFQAALLAEVQVQLNQLVADETITQEQADTIYANIEERIDTIVSAERGDGGFGPWHRGRGFGGPPLEESEEAEEAGITL